MLRLFDPVVSDKRQTINNGRSHQSYEFDASPLADRGTLEQRLTGFQIVVFLA